jgi:hypothetical protein
VQLLAPFTQIVQPEGHTSVAAPPDGAPRRAIVTRKKPSPAI